MGKTTDIWKAVEDQRPAGTKQLQWQHSYDGVKAALKHAGFELVTASDSFVDIDIPLDNRKRKNFSARKVVVTRAGCVSKPTMIRHLLSGNSGVLTDDERLAIQQKVGVANSAKQAKGVATTANAESRAIDELDALLGLTGFLYRRHLYEHRLADMAYCPNDGSQSGRYYSTHVAQEVWVGDQVKHSVAGDNGQCKFNRDGTIMTVAGMISYLNAGLSLTCIGKTADDKVDVVWFFHGQNDITMLSQFDSTQTFQPRLHLKITSSNEFTEAYNAKEHRYDVGRSADECQRLMERKLSVVRVGVKHTLRYLNEDDSQIPAEHHRLEHKAFAMTRELVQKLVLTLNTYSRMRMVL